MAAAIGASAASATAFTYIFIACAASTAVALVLFQLMPEKPVRGRETEIPPIME